MEILTKQRYERWCAELDEGLARVQVHPNEASPDPPFHVRYGEPPFEHALLHLDQACGLLSRGAVWTGPSAERPEMASTARENIAALAQAMIDGRLEPHAGCLAIVRASRDLTATEQDDPSLLFLVGVLSELDDVPVGQARQHWEPAALAERDAQRDSYLGLIRDDLLAACHALTRGRDR